MKEKTVQVSVRLPKSIYAAVKENAGSSRSFGAYISQAVQAYINQPTTIAKAVLEVLREAGALETHSEALISSEL